MAYKSHRALCSVLKYLVCFGRHFKTIIIKIIFLKIVGAKIVFRNYALKIALFPHIHPTLLN